MVSKTRMLDWVRSFQWRDVGAGLDETPALLGFRDERGRGWLHLCGMVNARDRGLDPADSVRTADVLLARGLDINAAAFTEGAWRATPLWCAIAWGRNMTLAAHLLKLGCDPNHCLFAAAYNHDLEAIRLLAAHKAVIDDPSDEGETPFLGAVKWSHFREAEELLEHGADVNARDRKGMTALHLMLRKGSDARHIAMLLVHGASVDIAGADGMTAAQIMSRKRDPAFRRLAEQFGPSL